MGDDDIWHRPPLDNEDGKALIVGEYEELMRSDESIKAFIDLLIEDETECDKLSKLLCGAKQSTKHARNELFDALQWNDDNDDGGLDPNDYDIDLRQMEEIFHKFNNQTLHGFVGAYFAKSLPSKPAQPWPIGVCETDIVKQQKEKTKQNAQYIDERRRKNKKRKKKKYKKKKKKKKKRKKKKKKKKKK